MITKKIYMVPETATEQFLKPMGTLMESYGFGSGNANVNAGDFQQSGSGNGSGAPQRKVF